MRLPEGGSWKSGTMHCLWKGCESLDACVVAVLLGVQQGFDGFWWFDGFAGVRQAGRACADAGQACRIMRGVLEGLSHPGAQHLCRAGASPAVSILATVVPCKIPGTLLCSSQLAQSAHQWLRLTVWR